VGCDANDELEGTNARVTTTEGLRETEQSIFVIRQHAI